MDLIDGLQKLAPWASDLPVVPKIALWIITIALNVLFLGLVWSPARSPKPEVSPAVVEAYERMQKILGGLYPVGDHITFEGKQIPTPLEDYYRPYVAIAVYLREHPGDVPGAYEQIWKHGGHGRVFISETTAFEAVVSRFFEVYEAAKAPPKKEA